MANNARFPSSSLSEVSEFARYATLIVDNIANFSAKFSKIQAFNLIFVNQPITYAHKISL